MSTIKSRLKQLEKSHSENEIVIVLSNSLEMEDGSIGNSPYAFSRIVKGMKIIFADEGQDYEHLL
jgi:hypothetical protein